MTDLHESFRTWLTASTRDELPRDVALHASACPGCLRAVAAFDALGAIDPGAAPEPPPWTRESRLWTPRAVLVARSAAGLAAVTITAAAGFIAAGGLIDRPDGDPIAARPTPQGEGVLGNAGGPPSASEATATATPSATPASRSASPTPMPSESTGPIAQDNPPMGGGPPPISPLRQTPTPQPPVAATPAPTARPTAAPTPIPATPTPVPTLAPTPIPDDCEDGLDNDGDSLIDTLDPGCALTGNEDGDALP
jgi:hypothetical protein